MHGRRDGDLNECFRWTLRLCQRVIQASDLSECLSVADDMLSE
jgi:hypothetical protein